MYPSYHHLAETLAEDRRREAISDRYPIAISSTVGSEPPEAAPRWWRLSSVTRRVARSASASS